MDEKDFSELLNNTRDLTIGQIFKLVLRIKYRVLVMFLAAFMALASSIYMAGQSSIKQETAVMLQSPFSMRIQINDQDYVFSHLTLIEDPMSPTLSEGTVMLSLKEIKSAFDIVPLGQIIARVDRDNSPAIWKWIFSKATISDAHAQTIYLVFDWSGHIKDFEYKEVHVDDHTIHRYYSDKCILEYEVDLNRRSIPSSFHWIKRTH